MNSDNKYFGSGLALKVIRSALADAATVRIATAFFEPSGFQCLMKTLEGKVVHLLIGREYDASGGIHAIVREFADRLMDGFLEERTEAMELLRNALAQGLLVAKYGKNSEGLLLDARHTPHHAKLYIADEERAVVASSNLTYTGLVGAREAGYTVTDREDVRYFVERFDHYFNAAESLTEELLAVLDDWLKLHSPYEIYVRSLLNLYGLPEEMKNQRIPQLAGYQVPVVSKLLQILREKRGGMLVASTGLGKTVMASHIAAYLLKEERIKNVIICCPAGLREMWDRMTAAVRVRYKIFSYHVLSADDWKKNRQVRELEYELREAGDDTLLIIDESHHLRNEEALKNELRLRNDRIIKTVRRGGYVLLMTATPYSKGVADINAQLRILPETSSGNQLYGDSRWDIESPAELSSLPVSVVLTAPTVVRNFSESDANGERYVNFYGDQKRYFPRSMSIHSITYHNEADGILVQLLKSGLLHIRRPVEEESSALFLEIQNVGRRDPLQEARFIHQFCSSSQEIDLLLKKMTGDGHSFEKVRFARQTELARKISELRREFKAVFNPEQDQKLKALRTIINKHRGQKVLIFCVYRETAGYLDATLKKLGYNCATTVDQDPDRVDLLLRRFAPVANEVLKEDPDYQEIKENPIEVLIATGSLAEGFNLQDASILVNFDLPWTVLVLAQRMGRILRPWREPRTIHIYNLIPSTMQNDSFYLAINWKERLTDRNRDLKSFSDLPVLHEESGSEDVEMISLARNMQHFENTELSLDDVLKFLEQTENLNTSEFLSDLSRISPDYARDVARIPAGFSSIQLATKRKGKIFLYVLFRYKNYYYAALFNSDGDIIRDSEAADEIMSEIRADKNESHPGPLAAAEKKSVENLLERCKKSWAENRDISPESVQIDCYMLLK